MPSYLVMSRTKGIRARRRDCAIVIAPAVPAELMLILYDVEKASVT